MVYTPGSQTMKIKVLESPGRLVKTQTADSQPPSFDSVYLRWGRVFPGAADGASSKPSFESITIYT